MKKFRDIIAKNKGKFKKYLIFGFIIFGFVLLFMPNVTYADLTSGLLGDGTYTKDISDLIRMISHIVYVFIWPCLVIAGTALDNSLVYGSFLHLDAALWNIWNIMKNFANFALGFLFVFSIVVNLFKGIGAKSDPIKNAKNTVTATLVAGVLVQMSWFLVAVLIDLSTILIYFVGGLPLSMVGTYNEEVADIPIMQMNAELSENESSYYYSYGDYNFSPCMLVNKQGDVEDKIPMKLTGEYIAGRKKLYMSNGDEFKSGYCTLNGYLYKYEESTQFFSDGGSDGYYYKESGSTVSEKNTSYYNQLVNYLLFYVNSGDAENTQNIEQEKNACFLINAYGVDYAPGSDCQPLCSGYGAVSYDSDIFSNSDGSAGMENRLTVKNLLNKSKGWVGPFVTMYSSILNYQELVMNPESGSVTGTLFGFVINTFFALVLFIPMAILAVLLVVRIGYLWVVVAISPILVLLHTYAKFDKDGPLKNFGKDFLEKRFSIKGIMMQIFSPVIIVFAVSLCIIFLTTIFKSKPSLEGASDTLKLFGVECIPENPEINEGENNCSTENSVANRNCSYSVLGLVTIKMNAQNYNHGEDMFIWVLMEFLATGIVWFFMKYAIEFTGKFSQKNIGKDLMGTAEKYMTTLPIIRLPGMNERVGLHALGVGEGSKTIIDRAKGSVVNLTGEKGQMEALEERFGLGNKSKASISETVAYIRKNNITDYNKLDEKYQNALSTIGYSSNNGDFAKFVETVRSDDYGELIKQGGKLHTTVGSVGHTNSEAVKYTSAQLDTAVKTDENWRAWAANMVSGTVQTSNGVFVVDYVKGTENTSKPLYRIVSREDYEKEHFDNLVGNIEKSDYANLGKDRQDLLKKYLKELQDELAELKRITNTNENDRTEQEKKQLEALKKLTIDQKTFDEIKNKLFNNS